MLGMSHILTVGRLSYIIPEMWPKRLSRISQFPILQKLSKITENSQISFLDGDITRKNEL